MKRQDDTDASKNIVFTGKQRKIPTPDTVIARRFVLSQNRLDGRKPFNRGSDKLVRDKRVKTSLSRHSQETNFFPSVPNEISKQFSLQKSTVHFPQMCEHKLALRNVRLKHGRKLAAFEFRGRVGSIVKCVEKCCRRRSCTVAFKVDGFCYSLYCPTEKACTTAKVKDARILSEYVMLNRAQDMNYSKFKYLF